MNRNEIVNQRLKNKEMRNISINAAKKENVPKLVECMQFEVDSTENNLTSYKLNIHLTNAGAFNYALRMYPKNTELPHRQDFHYLKWV